MLIFLSFPVQFFKVIFMIELIMEKKIKKYFYFLKSAENLSFFKTWPEGDECSATDLRQTFLCWGRSGIPLRIALAHLSISGAVVTRNFRKYPRPLTSLLYFSDSQYWLGNVITPMSASVLDGRNLCMEIEDQTM